MAGIQLRGLVKRYGKGAGAVPVLHGIDATVNDGEFVVIVGPSGCGKSTLLRMVAGLEDITEGAVHIGERVVNDLEPAERDIAMVFQNYALYPHMTVFDNMAYGLKIAGIAHDDIRVRVDKAAAILEQPIEAPAVVVRSTVPKVQGIVYRDTFKAHPDVDVKALARAVASGAAPTSFLTPNMAAINAFARATKSGQPVPGLKFIVDRQIAAKE